MRLFGLVGVLLALLIVGLLVKKQLAPVAVPVLPAVPGATATPLGAARNQSQQIQQQYKQALDAAMQPPRRAQGEN